MTETILWTSLSVLIVSLVSLVGILSLFFHPQRLEKILIYLVSLAAGTLLGDAFIHLLPSAFQTGNENILSASFSVLAGILCFFILEKIIHWRHCHRVASEKHPHPFSYVILFGDGLHNFIDGAIIAAGFILSFPAGLATTLAVILHEIPQEIGDFGSLVYGGFSRKKALWLNFLTALVSFLGAGIVLALNFQLENLEKFLVPFAAGGFIYIASTDLIPELHKDTRIRITLGQLLAIFVGIGLMLLITFLE